MEESGRNRTPDKLAKDERKIVYKLCDQYLADVVSILQPEWVVGVGGFALKRAEEALADFPELKLGNVLHPSPASPAANRGWAEQASKQLEELGIW
jgi:single-strand selective monofunctional uracil DNA glycosylase